MTEFDNSKNSSRTASRRLNVFTTALLLIPTILLSACASSPVGREPIIRNIPGPPNYLQPVAVPPARVGTSPFVVSEQRKQVIVKQNSIIVGARDAWTKMKSTYQKSFLNR